MSIQALSWAFKQKTGTASTKLVLVALANYADEQHSCFPSHIHLAEKCEISDRQVRRCLDDLCRAGLLTKKQRAGTSNRYYLGVDTHVLPGADARVLPPRTPMSDNTKSIRKQKRRSLNEIAG